MTIFVVTPSFNSCKTIERTIISVVFQAGNFEINYHVKDGGSTDGTVEILKKWQYLIINNKIPFFCKKVNFTFSSEKDNGIYDAIVKGFDFFRSDEYSWLGWINSDDILNPGVFALLSEVDAQCDKNSLQWIGGGVSVSYFNSLNVGSGARPLNSYVIKNGLCDGVHWDFVQQEGMFFRRCLWDKINIKSDFLCFKYAGDWNLWRVFAKHTELYQVDWPTGTFYRTEGQISQSFRNEYLSEIDNTVDKKARKISLHEMSDQDSFRNVIGAHFINGQIFLRNESIKSRRDIWKNKHNSDNEIKSDLLVKHLVSIPKGGGTLIAFDFLWQRPAITELNAFSLLKGLPSIPSNVIVLSFPWATIIDLLNLKNDPRLPKDNLALLINAINSIEKSIFDLCKDYRKYKIITVCQHVLLQEHSNLFHQLGITDIYWSHAIKGGVYKECMSGISIHPFPLYPVQYTNFSVENSVKDLVFSFVGARGDKGYLTDSRKIILEKLSSQDNSIVIDRDSWHYQSEVYDKQIYNRDAATSDLDGITKAEEYVNILKRSIFSLCPSGSGPNSIRLWESIGFGSIPVIISDTYLPPGNLALWEQAVIYCDETVAAIEALPTRLALLAQDEIFLTKKRHALKQIWMTYGPDGFIYDIQKYLLELEGQQNGGSSLLLITGYTKLEKIAQKIVRKMPNELSICKVFILGCCARVSSDPIGFLRFYRQNELIRLAYKQAIQFAPNDQRQILLRVLNLKNIDIDIDSSLC